MIIEMKLAGILMQKLTTMVIKILQKFNQIVKHTKNMNSNIYTYIHTYIKKHVVNYYLPKIYVSIS